MGEKMKYGIILVLLLIAPFVSATSGNQNEQAHLLASSTDVKCKTDFAIGVIDSAIKNAPNSSGDLSQYKTKLQSDAEQLKNYAQVGDKEKYSQFLHETFEKDAKETISAIVELRKSRIGKDAREVLRTEYDQLKKNYQSCHEEAVKKFAFNKLSVYEQEIKKYEEKIEALKAKDIKTDSLSKIVTDANNQIVIPLKNELNSANDSKSTKEVLDKYCLFNGCKNGTNFHLAAKFEMEKLNLILSNLEQKIGADKVAKAKEELMAAQKILATTGSEKYNPEDQIWTHIKSASEEIKAVIKSTREKQG